MRKTTHGKDDKMRTYDQARQIKKTIHFKILTNANSHQTLAKLI